MVQIIAVLVGSIALIGLCVGIPDLVGLDLSAGGILDAPVLLLLMGGFAAGFSSSWLLAVQRARRERARLRPRLQEPIGDFLLVLPPSLSSSTLPRVRRSPAPHAPEPARWR
jgi:hypothetical protein